MAIERALDCIVLRTEVVSSVKAGFAAGRNRKRFLVGGLLHPAADTGPQYNLGEFVIGRTAAVVSGREFYEGPAVSKDTDQFVECCLPSAGPPTRRLGSNLPSSSYSRSSRSTGSGSSAVSISSLRFPFSSL